MIIIKSLTKNEKWIAGVIVTCAIIGVGWSLRQNYLMKYQNYPQTTSQSEIQKAELTGKREKKLVYEFYYRPNCPDCQNLEKHGGMKYLRQAAKSQKLVMVNTQTFKKTDKQLAASWFSYNYINEVPTVIVKSGNMPMYTYSGTNINVYKKLGNQLNPKTNEKMVYGKSTHQYYVNDFTHSTTIFKNVTD